LGNLTQSAAEFRKILPVREGGNIGNRWLHSFL